MIRKTSFLAIAALAALVGHSANAAEWGNLKGRIFYDGAPPKPDLVTVTANQEFCGKFKIYKENVVVGKDGGLKNVFVFLYLSSGDPKPAIHPDYAKTESVEVVLDNEKCRFEPRALALRTTQTLVIGNKDSVGHNTKIDAFANLPINPLVPAGGKVSKQFPAPERLPMTVSCSIHPWMTARVLIKDHPYVAVTDENGNFEIKNIPAGDWTFCAWQEEAGYVDDIKLNGKPAEWKKGRFEVTIKNGETFDIGEVHFAP